jgi:hypothetical protein
VADLSIVCAWKDMGDPHRRAAFEFTRRYWGHHFPGAELVVGCPEPFTRASGLNAAIRAATTETIVQADPDSVAPHTQIQAAIYQARKHDGLVVPYSTYYYLGEEATARLHGLPPGALPYEVTAADCQFTGGGGCGPITVFSRATWEKAHGYDESFGLWGGDDGAFALACDAFCDQETRTVDGPMFHSYHPRLTQSIPGRDGYADQFAILAAYGAASARGGRDGVRQHVLSR